MASTCVTGFPVVLLVLQPWIALSNLLPPLFSHVSDDVCKEVVCGKGTCKPSNQSAFFLFECECDPGWKQANFGLAQNFKFLPCVVPNCTINYSCMNASSPVQDKGSRANESILDPCHWTDCGGGFCNKTSNLTYSCECAKDYYNILNDTSLPCFQDCAIGMDCSNLGISSSNKSTSTTQVSSDDGKNHGDYFNSTRTLSLVDNPDDIHGYGSMEIGLIYIHKAYGPAFQLDSIDFIATPLLLVFHSST
ncbi:hypothetical protein CFP56_041623 [Quercus suber]|uniref:EGF-like domain-containing protein n=1 Tax=Quercus suber TaxID=58331 RepID=A0AAW0IVI1_QUESU